jgi:hypothetical protein
MHFSITIRILNNACEERICIFMYFFSWNIKYICIYIFLLKYIYIMLQFISKYKFNLTTHPQHLLTRTAPRCFATPLGFRHRRRRGARPAAAQQSPAMAQPLREAIQTFVSITNADEAVAVRVLEVTAPARSPSSFLRPPPIGILSVGARVLASGCAVWVWGQGSACLCCVRCGGGGGGWMGGWVSWRCGMLCPIDGGMRISAWGCFQ